MNIRKPSIYSLLFDGLNRAMKSDATQIELYYEIARLIGEHLEKQAAAKYFAILNLG